MKRAAPTLIRSSRGLVARATAPPHRSRRRPGRREPGPSRRRPRRRGSPASWSRETRRSASVSCSRPYRRALSTAIAARRPELLRERQVIAARRCAPTRPRRTRSHPSVCSRTFIGTIIAERSPSALSMPQVLRVGGDHLEHGVADVRLEVGLAAADHLGRPLRPRPGRADSGRAAPTPACWRAGSTCAAATWRIEPSSCLTNTKHQSASRCAHSRASPISVTS